MDSAAGASQQPLPPDTVQVADVSRRVRAYTPRAPLVSQVDADDLDDGIVSLLSDGVERTLSRFRPSLAPDLKPEIELALKLLVYSVGVLGPGAAAPGAALQNLRLAARNPGRPPRSTLLLYLVLHPPILPNYLLTRLRTLALSRSWPDLPHHDYRRKLWTWIVRVENIARAWELAGWAWFLWDGRYPSLLMRALGLRLVPNAPHLSRMVSYEFMNRQLVWGVMTEFLMFAIPRIPSLPAALNPGTLVSPVTQFFNQPTTIDYDALSAAQSSISAAQRAGAPAPAAAYQGLCAGVPASTCPVCYLRRTNAPVELPGTDIELPKLEDEDLEADPEDRIFLAAQTDCWGQCKYCYYCIADELARFAKESKGEGKWTCLRCGGSATKAKRVGADPRTPKARSVAGESEKDESSDMEGKATPPQQSSDSEPELGDSWVAM